MRTFEKLCYLRRSDYCGMTPTGRLVFHGLVELLEDEPVLYVTHKMLACWLTLDQGIIRRGLKAIIESGMLRVEEQGAELRICYPGHKEKVGQK